jgi:hypothetical protein
MRFKMICEWLYQNAVAIIISSLISLIISRRYYCKGNRDNLLISVILPIVKLLEKSYSKQNYIEFNEIKTNYAIRYLHRKERKKLLALLNAYEQIYNYTQSGTYTNCIMSYFSYKLKSEGINPKPCTIEDDDGNEVADDYPPDYYYLEEQIEKIVSTMEFYVSPNDNKDEIIKVLNYYCKQYYTSKAISFFDDYTVEKVINESEVTKKWNERFSIMNQKKQEFLDLSICKKVVKFIN